MNIIPKLIHLLCLDGFTSTEKERINKLTTTLELSKFSCNSEKVEERCLLKLRKIVEDSEKRFTEKNKSANLGF